MVEKKGLNPHLFPFHTVESEKCSCQHKEGSSIGEGKGREGEGEGRTGEVVEGAGRTIYFGSCACICHHNENWKLRNSKTLQLPPIYSKIEDSHIVSAVRYALVCNFLHPPSDSNT